MSEKQVDQTSVVAETSVTSMTQNNLDFCRFWLAIQVIFSHSFALAEGDECREPLSILTSGQLNSGEFAVGCFFAISGFLITHSWLRSRSASSFLSKRVRRIYPGFVAAVLFGVFIVAPIGAAYIKWTARDILSLPLNLIALRNVEPKGVFPHNPCPGLINGSLWSIPYEFKCYLVVMLIGGLGLFRDRRLVLGILIAILAGGFFYRPDSTSVVERGAFAVIIGMVSFWCNVLPYFVAGMAYYLYRDQIPRSRQFLAIVSLILVISAVVPPAGRVAFPLAITFLLFWFAFHSPFRIYGWSRYGDFSYGIYLYAFPLQQLMVMRFPGISPVLLFLVSTPLAVIAGVISWHLLEKHFLKRATHAA